MGGDFLRVHVEIDVSKPLCRGRRVALDKKEEIWISFKYEKLPNFCYWCNLISHDGKDCDIRLARKDTRNTEPHQYGPWLRAMSFNLGKIPFTVVSGMGDGLGGVSIPSKMPTETAVRSTVTNTAKNDFGKKDRADQVQVSDMENVETEA